jgi:hypothetical protein
MLKIVCFKWKPKHFYRTQFSADAVNILRNMVRRNLQLDHEFICITDDPSGIDNDIHIIPLWQNPIEDFGGITKPNCFKRIKAFSTDMENIIGKRFCWLDLDCVITGDITQLLDNNIDFRIWKSTNPANYYNASMVLMNAGTRKEVWEDFTPQSPHMAANRGHVGSDQSWISYKLGNKEAKFTALDGVYSYRQIMNRVLPDNAKIVFFPGKFNPWDSHIQQTHKWVADNYR